MKSSAWRGRLAHDWSLDDGTLERFAALVAAHEREECAKIAETPFSGEQDDITMQAKDRVAAAIRARGEK
ncbi:MAG: hypothetical protein EBR60_09565 [Burkholderiaceae bacterium]|nr:hypothetical protein [Burkholderiaceae bacterium]